MRVEIVDLQGVFDDVAAAEHRSDWFWLTETDGGFQLELTTADTQIQQEIPGTFSAPGAEVDLFGDGTVEVIVAVFGPGCCCFEAVGVDLSNVKELASAKAVVGQQVLEDIREQVDGITSRQSILCHAAFAVDAELVEGTEFFAAADVQTDDRHVVVVRCVCRSR